MQYFQTLKPWNITSFANANHVLCTKPSLDICSVYVSLSFLWWHHKLFKHMLRKHEETGCFDFHPCAAVTGQGHQDYSKQYLQPPLWNPCVLGKLIRHCRPVSGQCCVKVAKNKWLWLCLSVRCKLGLWATNQLQDLLCNVRELKKITGQWPRW